MLGHCTALHHCHCPFSYVIYFYPLIFLILSFPTVPLPPFSLQSASTVGPYLCLCSASYAVDVLTELLNVVTVKNTASGDVLPCDFIEIYQHFRRLCCHQL